MKFRLVFPPMWRPASPYPSVPCLVAYLHQQGIDCEAYDLNLEFFEHVFSEGYLTQCAQSIGRQDSAIYTYLAKNVDACKTTLRSEAALDPEVYKSCNALLDNCMHLINQSWGPKERIRYNSYTSANYNPSRSEELTRCVRDVLEGRTDSKLYAVLEQYVATIVDDAQLVGFSICNESQMIPAYTMAALCKKRKPSVKIVIGGVASTVWATGSAKLERLFDAVDYYSFYEGEIPLTLLCRYLQGEAVQLSEIPGLAYLADGKPVVNAYTKSISMDELPAPEYDPKTLHRYFSPVPVLSVFTSRGCFWNRCAFCSHAAVSHDCYRLRSIDKVLEDIEYYYHVLGVRYFDFNDEAVTAATYRKLSRQIIDRKLDIRWRAYARFDKTMTPDVFRLAYQAGLRRLHFGLESYNERVLKLMNKGIDKQNVLPILQASAQAGIWNHVYLICGFPTETIEEFDETYSFIVQNRACIHSVACGVFVLTPFSTVSRKPEDFGIRIIDDEKNDMINQPRFVMLEGFENASYEKAGKENYQLQLNKILGLKNIEPLRHAGIVFTEYAMRQRELHDELGDDYADTAAVTLYSVDGTPAYVDISGNGSRAKQLPAHMQPILQALMHCRSKRELCRSLEQTLGYPAPVVERFLDQL